MAHATFHARRDLLRRPLAVGRRPGRIAAMGDRAS
jgi:hypothetical protein